MARTVFAAVRAGVRVSVTGRPHIVTHILSASALIVSDVATGTSSRILTTQIERVIESEPDVAVAGMPDLAAVPEAAWKVAQNRYAVIAELVDVPDRRRSDVERAAIAAGVHGSTVYDWLGLYERSGSIASLLPGKRGRRPGPRLDPVAELIISSAIQTDYLTKRRKSASAVVKLVKKEANNAAVAMPHPNTIRRRIKQLDPRRTLAARGDREGARRLDPAAGGYPTTSRPMEVVQIDHTLADVQVLGSDRLPIGRPHVTLAIDVHTRMVAALVVSMEKPNTHTVGMCISQAMLPKASVLAALNIPGEWPIGAPIGTIAVDNAREFDSKDMRRACGQYGIGIEFRPPGEPHFGGHIERLMLAHAQEVQTLPGTTFSNIRKRMRNNPAKEAVMTLDEFERWLFDFFVNEYNVAFHQGISTTPLAKFTDAIDGTPTQKGIGMPAFPTDPARLRIDFLPAIERTVDRRGVQIDLVRYWDAVLTPWLGTDAGAKHLFRRDPRKISPIYFFDPKLNEHVPIHYADRSRPVISVWELRETMKTLKATGQAAVKEDAIFESQMRRDRIIEEATSLTKAERTKRRKEVQRREARLRAQAQTPEHVPNTRAEKLPPSAPVTPAMPPKDLFDAPPVRASIIRVNIVRS